MNMKHFAIGVLLLSVLPAIASASCLSSSQVITMNTMLERMNATANERTVFFSAFEDVCTRSYSRNETDQRIGDINNINVTVKTYMDNYTRWFEDRTSGNKALEAIRDMMNATASLAQIDERIDNKIIKIQDEIDDRLENIEENDDKYVTQMDIASMRMNLTRDFDFRESQITGKFTSQSTYNMQITMAVIVIACIALLVYFRRSQDDKRRNFALSTAPIIDRARRKFNLQRPEQIPDLDSNGMPIDDADEESLAVNLKKRAAAEKKKIVDEEKAILEKEYEDDKKNEEDKLKKMFKASNKEAKK